MLGCVAGACSAKPVNFAVGQAHFSLSPPEGYCLPSGEDAAAAATVVAGDPANNTLVFVMKCNEPIGIGAADYTRITSPLKLADEKLSKDDVFKKLGNQTVSSGTLSKISENISRAISNDVSVGNKFYSVGQDDTCIFQVGLASISSTVHGNTVGYDQGFSTCTTVISGKIIAITRYGAAAGADDLSKLSREAKTIATQIHAKD